MYHHSGTSETNGIDDGNYTKHAECSWHFLKKRFCPPPVNNHDFDIVVARVAVAISTGVFIRARTWRLCKRLASEVELNSGPPLSVEIMLINRRFIS
jgi:hypothetical protein